MKCPSLTTDQEKIAEKIQWKKTSSEGIHQCTMPVIRETWGISKTRLQIQHLEQMLSVAVQNTPVFKPMAINDAKHPYKF